MQKLILIIALFAACLNSNGMEQTFINGCEKSAQKQNEDRCDIIFFENTYNEDLHIYIADRSLKNLTDCVQCDSKKIGEPDGDMVFHCSNYFPYVWFVLKSNKTAYLAFSEKYPEVRWPISMRINDKDEMRVLNNRWTRTYALDVIYQFAQGKSDIRYTKTVHKRPATNTKRAQNNCSF